MDQQLAIARYMFDRTGQVKDGVVRPLILESWKRSRHLPVEVRNPPVSKEKFKQILRDNARLLKASQPVEQLLSAATLHTFVFLSSDCYCIDQICHEDYLYQLGTASREEDIGTTATALVLRQDIPVQTVRYENYALRYQHCSIASAPIHDERGRIVGVLSLVTNFGKDLPDHALHMVTCAARIIEERFQSTKPLPIQMCGAFPDLLNASAEQVLVIDRQARILGANDALLHRFQIYEPERFLGRHLQEFVYEPGAVDDLLRIEEPEENITFFFRDKKISCALAEKISDSSMISHEYAIALVFRPGSRGGVRQNGPAEAAKERPSPIALVGESQSWQQIKRAVDRIATIRSTKVLLEGESGTGKEQVAKAIHAASGRTGEMIAVNCGALPRELLQSELFGYVDGAFTGAKKGGSVGKIEMANGGTLFLDEIGEMPLDMQVTLLRVLEERKIVRLGSAKSVPVDLNIIAATNRNLRTEVAEGRFREDLYYRLSVIKLVIPPLRERREDIPLLAEHLIGRLCERMQVPPLPIRGDAMKALMEYHWPGNIRELQNVLEYALVFCEEEAVTEESIRSLLQRSEGPEEAVVTPHQEVLAYANRKKMELISATLKKNNGNISKTARELGVCRNTIYRNIYSQAREERRRTEG